MDKRDRIDRLGGPDRQTETGGGGDAAVGKVSNRTDQWELRAGRQTGTAVGVVGARCKRVTPPQGAPVARGVAS